MEKAIPRIDLHMHTVFSDGTDTPETLLPCVREAGLVFFSVTDHDAIGACEAIRALLKPGDPRFLPGVEFSCQDGLGKYHILGYGYDPASDAIGGVVRLGHEYRMEKLGKRLRMLRDRFHIVFPESDERALYALPNPGKPHIARLMVQYGHAGSIRQAFETVLNRLTVPDLYVRPEEAIKGVLGAGGIPVLAHPCFGDGDQLILGQSLNDRVERLMRFGLMGLEGYYSGYTEKLRQEVLALADRHDLYVTAGSDYHGANKMIRLGDVGFPDGDRPVPALLRFIGDAFKA